MTEQTISRIHEHDRLTGCWWCVVRHVYVRLADGDLAVVVRATLPVRISV